MKKLMIILCVLFLTKTVPAQNKRIPTVRPDLNKLLQMTPAEQEAYKKQILEQASKQAKQIATENNFKIDKTTLPGYEIKMPVKETKLLALLPAKPPTMLQLIDDVKKTRLQVLSRAPNEVLNEVNSFSNSLSAAKLEGASIAAFYNDQPIQALLLSMQSVLKNSHAVIAWNNLSSIYNMVGLPQKAIPVLMHHLQNLPNNPMLLNNMGQAYFGLGDLITAKIYLNKCLQHDSLNPEANRTMGMVKLLENDPEGAREHFEKEEQITRRESTIALINKNRFPINLYLSRAKNKAVPNRNFFDELQLNKFKMPDFPDRSEKTKTMGNTHGVYLESIVQELLFWGKQATATPEQLAAEGKRLPGLYAKQVDRLLKDLHKVYSPKDMVTGTEIITNQLLQITNEYDARLYAVTCPVAPTGANMELVFAFQKKCCEIKKPLLDEYIARYNAVIGQRINFVSGVWKQFINEMINIVSLDPSPANKRYVSGFIVQYFTTMASASQAGLFLSPPEECHVNMSEATADSLIASSRQLDLKCPDGIFKLDLSFGGVNLFLPKGELQRPITPGILKPERPLYRPVWVWRPISGKNLGKPGFLKWPIFHGTITIPIPISD
jgi:tetratricopeptide (TPR) repeat protein